MTQTETNDMTKQMTNEMTQTETNDMTKQMTNEMTQTEQMSNEMTKEEFICFMMQIPRWRKILLTEDDLIPTELATTDEGDMCFYLGQNAQKREKIDLATKWFLFGGMKQHRGCMQELHRFYFQNHKKRKHDA